MSEYRASTRFPVDRMKNDRRTLALALEHQRAGRIDDAEALFRRLLDADPADADALHGLGLVALGRGDIATALDLVEEATERNPQSALFMSNLAAVHHKARLVERARECAERAIALDPGFADAWINHGHALATLGDAPGAEQSYRKALALRATPFNRLNVGLMRLAQGDYDTGLPLYEARLEGERPGGDAPRMLAKLRGVTRWRGEPLMGRAILVWTEQGLGDTLMTLRYLPLLRERGAGRIAVACEAVLVRLVESMGVADEVFSDVDDESWPQRFAAHCPTMSLPLAFGTTLATIPRPVRYLDVPDALKEKWASRTAALGRPRVGLAWAGRKETSTDAYRSVSLRDFEPVLAHRGASFVSLQKGPPSAQLADVRRPISHWMDECDDLLETAALIESLDLVITVDTAVVHLAAALGRPTWLVNRHASEWRWLREGSDAPWYPTVRIFRQQGNGWSGVFGEIAAALEQAFPQPRGLLRKFFGV